MSEQEQRQILYQKTKVVEPGNFEKIALKNFRYQAIYNPVYAQYISLLGVDIQAVKAVQQIPFLPIQLFKNHSIRTGEWKPYLTFTSSGTTAETTSSHFLRSADFYKQNARRGFQQFYGDISNYCVLALLPSYLERTGSSLIFMAQDFIEQSKYEKSGFFLDDLHKLVAILKELSEQKIPVLLLGVSFALLDLAEQFSLDLSSTIVMETGGMKGRRKEMTRQELHEILKNAFHVDAIHSEYGMTELFSQAYSKGNGLFFPAHTMRVYTREITDPFQFQQKGKAGAVNIIDLANLDTCSFIATDDLGRVFEDGSFEILGRLDASDIRGCNLLVS